jgi:hypothetical protein
VLKLDQRKEWLMPKNDQKPGRTAPKSQKQQADQDLAFPINITDIDLSKVVGGFSGGGGSPLPVAYSTVMCCW